MVFIVVLGQKMCRSEEDRGVLEYTNRNVVAGVKEMERTQKKNGAESSESTHRIGSCSGGRWAIVPGAGSVPKGQLGSICNSPHDPRSFPI